MIYNFKKGDKVKFKTWDEILREFGLNKGLESFMESIDVEGGFPHSMEEECDFDKVYTIKSIINNGVYFENEDRFTAKYRITPGMLKPAKSKKATIVLSSDNTKFVNAAIFQEGKRLKSAYARCHPDDEFDLYVGADIALRRLLGVEEKKTVPLKDSPLAPPPETARLKIEYHYDLCSPDGRAVRLKTIGGTLTKFRDALGKTCFTGDVVEVFNNEARSLGYYYVLEEDADHAYIGEFEPNEWIVRLQNHFFIKRVNYDADTKILTTILGKDLKAHGVRRLTRLYNAV